MATVGNYTIYVPDRTDPVRLPVSLTIDEVRQSLVGMGYTSVETAELLIESGNVLRFRRPVGGTKGL